MFDSYDTTPAEHILSMVNDSDVFGFVSELTRSRQLSFVVQSLNAAVLDGGQEDRDMAIAALSRMGMWLD